MIEFDYGSSRHVRRHGPAGYSDYTSYREWLRDEFIFRCAYCLHREQWNHGGAAFHIDHAIPAATDTAGILKYANLVYACARCNEAKRAVLGLPDPCQVSFSDCLRILNDGRIEALNGAGKKLKMVLLLDSEKVTAHRLRWIRNLELLRTTDMALYQEYMGFPKDLPDLRKKQAPENTKPEGAANCYFVLRERGELPATY